MPTAKHRKIRSALISKGIVSKSAVRGGKRKSIQTLIDRSLERLEKMGVEPERLFEYCSRFKNAKKPTAEFSDFCRPVLSATKASKESEGHITEHLRPIFDALIGRMLYDQKRRAFAEGKRLDEEFMRITRKR